MAKRLKLNRNQLNTLINEIEKEEGGGDQELLGSEQEDDQFMGHPVGGTGGDEYNPQDVEDNMATFRAFKNEAATLYEGGMVVEFLDFMQNIISFLQNLLTDPSQEGLSTFWKKLGVTRGELLSAMADVGLLSWATIHGTKKFYVYKENFKKKVKKLYEMLTEEEVKKNRYMRRDENEIKEQGNFPAGAESDPRAPFNRDDQYSEPEEPDTKEYKVVHMNDEIAILKKNQKYYVFGYGFVDDEQYEPYSFIPVEKRGKDEEGFDDYDYGDWEIDGDTVERYVNDNLHELEFGYGVEDYSSGSDIILINDELQNELIDTYPEDDKLRSLFGVDESTSTGEASGDYTTKMGATTIKKHQGSEKYSPKHQLKNRNEGLYEQIAKKTGQPINYVKKVVKDAKKLEEDDNSSDENYSQGGFVEFDDCVKFNNNDEAEEGGCSQGAADNVVKVKKSVAENYVFNEIAKRTGKPIEEVRNVLKKKY